MNKNLVIAAIVVIILILLGGFLFINKNNKMGQSANPATGSNSISSITDALANKMSLQCNYTTPSGTKVVAYVKNGMIRSDISGSAPQDSGSTIIKDKKIYFWNSESAFVMNMPDVTSSPSAGQGNVVTQHTSLEALNQYKNYCKNAVVADSLFVLPTGINFQDTSGMMKVAPSGIKVSTGPSNSQMTQQQIQAAIKKYQAPSK